MRQERKQRREEARRNRMLLAEQQRARKEGGVVRYDPDKSWSSRCVAYRPLPTLASYSPHTCVPEPWIPTLCDRPRSPAYSMAAPHRKPTPPGDAKAVMLPWGGIPLRSTQSPTGDEHDLVRAHRSYVVDRGVS